MLEQVKVLRSSSYEGVADAFNDWMIANESKVSSIVDIEYFTEWIPSNETLSVSESRTDYLIRVRYSTTLQKLNE